jgi:hypothetical protein
VGELNVRANPLSLRGLPRRVASGNDNYSPVRSITSSPDGVLGKWSMASSVSVSAVHEVAVKLLLAGLWWRQRKRSLIKGW